MSRVCGDSVNAKHMTGSASPVKPVRCKETGVVYPNIIVAAEDTGISFSSIQPRAASGCRRDMKLQQTLDVGRGPAGPGVIRLESKPSR
eukprot:g59126.t1